VVLKKTLQFVELVSGEMSYIRPHMYSAEVSYFDFLNRVRMEEESLRMQGLWDVPHPWLNMFVPRHAVARLKDLLMDTVLAGHFDGAILVYPLLADKYVQSISCLTHSCFKLLDHDMLSHQ
jgi:cytokinin dehydrogenase